MPEHITSIRSKLTPAEIEYLQIVFGIDLRDPEVIAALSELDGARRQLAAIEEAELRKVEAREGLAPHCSFCGATSHAVGPLARSSHGPSICRDCAIQCISILEKS